VLSGVCGLVLSLSAKGRQVVLSKCVGTIGIVRFSVSILGLALSATAQSVGLDNCCHYSNIVVYHRYCGDFR